MVVVFRERFTRQLSAYVGVLSKHRNVIWLACKSIVRSDASHSTSTSASSRVWTTHTHTIVWRFRSFGCGCFSRLLSFVDVCVVCAFNEAARTNAGTYFVYTLVRRVMGKPFGKIECACVFAGEVATWESFRGKSRECMLVHFPGVRAPGNWAFGNDTRGTKWVLFVRVLLALERILNRNG